MAGQRQAKDHDLVFQPGVVTVLTDRDARGRWKDSNRVRWHKSLAEKLGGWVRQTLTGANSGIYIGIARALHDWSSLDTQQWIGVGTNCKLYLINNGTLFDVTPLRKSSNTINSLSVSLGSATITVVDPDHRADVGDHVIITASAPLGGFAVSGTYDIDSIIDPDTYTVTFTSNFSNTETGGGSVTVEYDISCGLEQNGELLGYGTGEYGVGTYGTPRPVGSGVPARMRIWSLDSWGEDLVASPSDGELYWWDKTTGPNSRAVLIANAPTGIQRILVNPENRFLIALGCSGLDGVFDPMRVRWCSQEDFNTWIPTLENTAGGKRLDYGSRLITGVRTSTQILVWSDTQLYSMQFVGAPLVFGFLEKGACKIVGPNAAIDVNGVVYFFGFDDFFVYDGTLRVIPCDVHTRVFGDEGRNTPGDFDRTQAEAVYCASYMAKNEVTWFYPSTAGGMRYVTLNYSAENPCWYYGQMERTAYHDVSEAITGYKTNPYGVNGGYLYKHEVGTDEVEGATTTPQAWYLESYDNNVGGSDAIVLVNFIVPNFARLSGSMRMTLKKKSKPRQPTYQIRGPYLIEEDTVESSVRCKASQIALRLESNGETGEDFRMGIFQINATPYGGRMGRHSDDVSIPPGPVVLFAEYEGPDAPPQTIFEAVFISGPNEGGGRGYSFTQAGGNLISSDLLNPSLDGIYQSPTSGGNIRLELNGLGVEPDDDVFVSITVTNETTDTELFTLLLADATITVPYVGEFIKRWQWVFPGNQLVGDDQFRVVFE